MDFDVLICFMFVYVVFAFSFFLFLFLSFQFRHTSHVLYFFVQLKTTLQDLLQILLSIFLHHEVYRTLQ